MNHAIDKVLPKKLVHQLRGVIRRLKAKEEKEDTKP